jgi:succinate dehydrogenase / fumarate reductase cytochrome b subunit
VPSIAKKYVMAVTGAVLAGFALVHMIGNLQMFQSPEHINVYAHFLQHLPPPALWGFRAVMLLCVALHAATGLWLAVENRAARGSEQYAVKQSRVATLFAKAMPYTGLVLLAFVVFHIFHYTVKAPASLGTGAFKSVMEDNVHSKLFGVFDYPIFKGETVNDAYNMVVTGFSSAPVALFYVLAMALLCAHLGHGIASAFQTVGLRNEKWRGILAKVGLAYGVVVFAGLAAVPLGVLAGKAAPETKCPLAIKAKFAAGADSKTAAGAPVFTPCGRVVTKPAPSPCCKGAANPAAGSVTGSSAAAK